MTVAEWHITDVGYIWIREDDIHERLDFRVDWIDDEAPRYEYRVFFDPGGVDQLWDILITHDPNMLANLEVPDCEFANRVMSYLRKLGSPRLNRKDANYAAPWFPWREGLFCPIRPVVVSEAIGIAP